MISLFSHAISTLLTKLLSKLFDKWGNSYIDRENEENSYRRSVRVSKIFGIVGGIWFICFAAFGILSIVIWVDGMTDWDSFACGVLFLLISLFGAFCMLFRRNYRIFYTSTFVEKHGIFGKKQVYRWAELISIQQKGAVYTLFFPVGKLRIVSSKEYVGSDKLVDFFEKEIFFEKRLDKPFIL